MSSATGARCVRCNSWLDPGAAFCAACGAPVTDRVIAPPSHVPPGYTAEMPVASPSALAIPGTVDASRGLRLCAFLIDLGTVLVAVLLVLVVALVTDVRAVAYYIAPLAAFATWVWLQECQGLTGCTVGKAVMGLRLVSVPQGQLPGIAAVIARSVVFVVTLGVAGLVLTRSAMATGRAGTTAPSASVSSTWLRVAIRWACSRSPRSCAARTGPALDRRAGRRRTDSAVRVVTCN